MRSTRAMFCGCLWMLIAVWSVASTAQGAAPESLVSLVPSDVGLCVEMDHLAQHGGRFQSGEFFRRLEFFPPFAEWSNEYSKSVSLVLKRIANHLGESPDGFLRKLFGRKVVLGAWPSDGGELNDGPGLILVDTEDAELLAKTIDTLCQGMHPGDKEDGPRQIEHAGSTYRVRSTGTGESQKFVYLTALDHIGVLTNTESVMQAVLELHAGQTSPIESVGSLATYRDARQHVPSDSTITVFINPQRWNAHKLFSEMVDEGFIPSGDAFRHLANGVWQASDYWVTGIQLGDDVRVKGFLHIDQSLLGDAYRDVLASLQGEPTFLDRVPQNAILAMTGNVDFGLLVKGVLAGKSDSDEVDLDTIRNLTRGMLLGLDLFDEVLPALGPEFGVYLVPEETTDEEIAPAWVAGIQTRSLPSDNGQGPSVGAALQNGLKTFLSFASGFLNGQGQDSGTVRVNTTRVGVVEVTSLEGVAIWPKSVVATVAASDDFVMVGTSREAVIQSLQIEREDSLGQCSRFRKVLAGGLENPSQIVYIDCRRMRKVLEQDGNAILNTVVRARRLDKELARRSLEQLGAVMALSDHLFGAIRVEESGIAYCVTFTMDGESRGESEVAGDPRE